MAKVELPKVNEDQLKRSTLVMKSIDTTVISIAKFLGRKEKFTAKQKKFLKIQKMSIPNTYYLLSQKKEIYIMIRME